MELVESKWSEHFYYDPSSESCLRWARNGANNKIKIGDVAGWLTGKRAKEKRYYRVRYLGGSVAVARVIWEIFNGDIPEGMQIDHVDGNSQNNVVSNLRLTNNRDNCCNKGRNSLNTTGHTGVHRGSNGRGSFYYVAQWSDKSGNRKSKRFPVVLWGEEEALNLTVAWRELQIQLLVKQGVAYTERHGK